MERGTAEDLDAGAGPISILFQTSSPSLRLFGVPVQRLTMVESAESILAAHYELTEHAATPPMRPFRLRT
jgi:hypothetical protein